MDEVVQITVRSASIMTPPKHVEVQNLEIVHAPTGREETYRWLAMPRAPGAASVGRITGDNGVVISNNRFAINVLAPPMFDPADPVATLRALEKTRNEPAYIDLQISPSKVMAGQEAIATWHLYHRKDTIKKFAMPKIALPEGVHAEDLERGNDRRLLEADPTIEVRTLAVLSLVPAAAGVFEIPPMELTLPLEKAFIPEPSFIFERTIRRVVPGARFEVTPRDPAIDVVGHEPRLYAGSEDRTSDLAVTSFYVTLSIRGDISNVSPPRWAGPLPPNLSVSVEESATRVRKVATGRLSDRMWRFTLRVKEGTVTDAQLPALTMEAFDTATNERRTLSAGVPNTVFLTVRKKPAEAPAPAKPPLTARIRSYADKLSWVVIAVVLVMGFRFLRRSRE